MSRHCWALLAVLLAGCSSRTAAPDHEIRAVLDRQSAAWNRGDIRTYMEGYAHAPDTVFVGRDVSRGYDTVLNRYLQKYSTPAQMGQLTFQDVEIHPLGPDDAWVLGHWSLRRTREGGGDVGGWYTLVFHRTPGGWKIVLDHTS